jgi:predicted nucleic acid-binding protein
VSTPGHGLLDTSAVIAQEVGRPLGELPARLSVSVVTIGELELGVLAASDDRERARRTGTLAWSRRFDPIPVTEAVMAAWARLIHDCRAAGIRRVAKVPDSLIAATAIAHGLPVVAQDDDYDAMSRAHPPLRVVKV